MRSMAEDDCDTRDITGDYEGMTFLPEEDDYAHFLADAAQQHGLH